jgi:hypothetical protein
MMKKKWLPWRNLGGLECHREFPGLMKSYKSASHLLLEFLHLPCNGIELSNFVEGSLMLKS